jgi:hypothetical protein
MKMIKSLVLGSAAGLLAMSGAQAADLPVKAKAVEYVRVCSLYGAGFFYMPGTDTCIKFGGYLRADVVWNTNNDYNFNGSGSTAAHNRLSNYFTDRARFDLDVDTRTATEYGVVRTFAQTVFSWTTGGFSGSNPTTQDTAAPSTSTTLGVYQAFIQFAGFTIGRAYSVFDAPWQSYPAGGPDSIPGASNHVTGSDQLTYTASFGNGITGSISLEDPTEKDVSNVWNLSGISAAGVIGGAYGNNAIAGTRAPDVIGQFRVDQAWGLAQIAVAAHDNHVSYYGANELTGHPQDKWGFAVQGALSIKNIPTGPGDTINMTAVYTDGASRYNFGSLLGTNAGIYGGTGLLGAYQSIGIYGVSDATFTGTSGANGSGLESVKTWGFQGGFTHNWSPTWASAIYGGWAQLRYGNAAKSTICTFMTNTMGLTGNCNPDFSLAVLGGNVVWTPVKNLAFTVDVNWTHLDQKFSGTINSPGAAAFAKPAGVYELKNQDVVSALFRAQRNF